jgi:hypothetical protein
VVLALALGAVVAVTALPGPAFNVVLTSYNYALAPDRLQARTVGAARLVVWGRSLSGRWPRAACSRPWARGGRW